MKAGYYTGNRTYEVREVEDRDPIDDEVKIQVAWCGLCGTDLHKFEGRNGAGVVIPPIILGHECAGRVIAVGAGVKRFKIGDRVACDPSYSCGKCSYCQEGLPNFCVERHGVAKGFSEVIHTPEKNVYPIPDSLDLQSAAFAEPLSCAIHGLDLLQMKSGKNVVMYGMGAIGSLMLQLVLKAGASQVVVVEREAQKRELAITLGATKAVDDVEIVSLSKAMNIDYVIECIGLTSTMEQAIEIAGKNAKVLLFGLGDPNQKVSFNQFIAYTKELSIYTSYLNPLCTKRAIDLLANKVIDTKSIISAEIDMEAMGEELDKKIYAKQGKVMVRLSGEK